ncbi:MAG TPA: SsrA-binding protein SmpB [Candidatus Andersenbacteria bacterium]|nr:SsrA-binding protein SmpB [Candidatus Andersenbacteria bacterium]
MPDLARNKRARFDYDIIETLEAGVALLGTEVKSVKAGHMSLRGAFVTFHGEEAYLTNATIPPWQVKNAPGDYDPTRPRKLLLQATEVKHLLGSKQAKGLTIIPIRAYTKGPRVKLEIGLARGRKKYDQKQTKKERDIQRDIDRVLSGRE